MAARSRRCNRYRREHALLLGVPSPEKEGQTMDRTQFVETLKAKIDEWNAEIDKLEARMRQESAEQRAEYEKRMEEVRAQRDRATEELRRHREESEAEWEKRRVEAERAWDDIREGFRRAWERVTT
jgi:chromosome segregation ATPase